MCGWFKRKIVIMTRIFHSCLSDLAVHNIIIILVSSLFQCDHKGIIGLLWANIRSLSSNNIDSRYGLASAVTGKPHFFDFSLILILVNSLFAYSVTSSSSLLINVNKSGSNRSMGFLRRRLEGSVGRIRSKFVNSYTKYVSKIIGLMWSEHTH
jgi:hypothetical protein